MRCYFLLFYQSTWNYGPKQFHVVQVFCIAEEDAEAGELKTDVKKFLYDLRMAAEVIVLSMKAWQAHQEDNEATGENGRIDALEVFSKARKRIAQRETAVAKKSRKISSNEAEAEPRILDEQQVNPGSIFTPNHFEMDPFNYFISVYLTVKMVLRNR